ncbi:MAG: LysR family transcriptional regulator substrate-binding protein [Rhodoglobus sp.]|nr:LysR family transcriptional regulator substrate-binding protein [Rhodoglobus sp.]
MDEPTAFVVAYVVGVTPGKWARVWGERMPRHPLELRALDAAEAVEALDNGTAHVALVRLPIDADQLSAIPLYIEQPFVVAPKGHALEALDSATLADLSAETVLDGRAGAGANGGASREADAWAANVELVAANVGVAIMPQSVARALSRKDVIARPVTDAATTQIALAWRTAAGDAAGQELIEEFVGIVRGRTANSSRGAPTPPTPPAPKAPKAGKSSKGAKDASGAKKSASPSGRVARANRLTARARKKSR